MRKEGIRSENSNQAICWATHKEAVSQQVTRSVSGNIRPHRDPTADAAIGNVMREEKLRKAKQRKQKCRKAKQHGAHQANKQRRDCIQCGKGGQRMSRSKHYSDFSHGRSSEYNYEREVYVDDQCCQNCRYWCDWDPDGSQNGCKNYGREDYEQKPANNWCMDWKGERGNKGKREGVY